MIMVAPGLTAAAVLALTPATPVSYVPPEPYRSLADCESDSTWDANTGNGYFGGVQFSLRSWRWVDADEFADRPDRATPAEQVEAARRLVDLQGWAAAFPACSRKLGLR